MWGSSWPGFPILLGRTAESSGRTGRPPHPGTGAQPSPHGLQCRPRGSWGPGELPVGGSVPPVKGGSRRRGVRRLTAHGLNTDLRAAGDLVDPDIDHVSERADPSTWPDPPAKKRNGRIRRPWSARLGDGPPARRWPRIKSLGRKLPPSGPASRRPIRARLPRPSTHRRDPGHTLRQRYPKRVGSSPHRSSAPGHEESPRPATVTSRSFPMSRSPPTAQIGVNQPSSAQLKRTSSARSIENVLSRSTPI